LTKLRRTKIVPIFGPPCILRKHCRSEFESYLVSRIHCKQNHCTKPL